MIAPILLATLVGPAGAATGPAAQGPEIRLWTDRGEATVYHRGERVRVYFRADEDAYVTVLRVDTDGRVRVLFPEEPWDDNFARGGVAYEVRPRDLRYAFAVDEYPGQGYVFAIATLDPFDYRGIVRGDHWDYGAIASGGRITGDPYVALQDLADLIVPANYELYSYDLATYYVEHYYDYPRFLCYDCHSYVTYTYWDPYAYSCNRFQIVVYDDPYYYPARVYAANRVVYRRVVRIEPRYVFKDRTPTDAYVVRVRQRPAEPVPRRADQRGVTGRDIGGVGTVRAPVRGQPGLVPERRTGEGLAPARRPDVVNQPIIEPVPPQPALRATGPVPERRPTEQPIAEPRRVPERDVPRTTDRPRAPSTLTTPRTTEPERPKLERREPPARVPATRAEPRRPEVQARPPAAKPAQPAKPPETAAPKKPEPPRKKPGG